MSCQKRARLALADVQADRAGVVVLEVVKRKVSVAADLIADSLTSSAVIRGDHVRVARGDSHRSEVRLLTRLVGVGGLLASGALKLGEVNLTRARKGERRGLEVLLLGEQEDNGAGLAGIGSGYIEVEDRAGVTVDLTIVGSTEGLGGLLRVDRNDQVGILVGAI